MKTRIAVFAFLLSLAGPALADSAKTSLMGPMADRFNAISGRLICQCNCRMILEVCNHQNCPSGIPMRKEIEAKLQQGQSDDDIVNGFVSRMGKIVLSAPPAKGGYLLAWILPFAALGTGGTGLVLWLKKRNRGKAAASPPPPALSPDEEEKFKKEWSRWNQP